MADGERPFFASELSGADHEHLPRDMRAVDWARNVREGYGDQTVDVDLDTGEIVFPDQPMGRTPLDDLRDEIEGTFDDQV